MKYVEMDTLSLEDSKEILKGRKGDTIDVLHVMNVMRCDPHEAYDHLLTLHAVGYLEMFNLGEEQIWSPSRIGNQLRLDPLSPRFDGATRDQIVSDIAARANAVNADPDSFTRVQVYLYGSAIREDAQDFGDVDIHISHLPRRLSADEKTRLTQKFLDAAPKRNESTKYFSDFSLARMVSEKAAEKAIVNRDPRISVNSDPRQMDTDYIVLAAYDDVHDRPRAPDGIVYTGEDSYYGPVFITPPPNPFVIPELAVSHPLRKVKVDLAGDDVAMLDPAVLNQTEIDLWTPVNGEAKTARTATEILSVRRHVSPGWGHAENAVDRLSGALDAWSDFDVTIPTNDVEVSVQTSGKSAIMVFRDRHSQPFASITFEKNSTYPQITFKNERTSMRVVDLMGCHGVLTSIADLVDYDALRRNKIKNETFRISDLGSETAPAYFDFTKTRNVSLLKANLLDVLTENLFSEPDLNVLFRARADEPWVALLTPTTAREVSVLRDAIEEVNAAMDHMGMRVDIENIDVGKPAALNVRSFDPDARMGMTA